MSDPGVPDAGPAGSRNRRALAVLVAGLAVAVVARSTVVPSGWHLPFNLAVAVFALGVGRFAGLDADELGCSRRRLGSGFRYGAGAFVAISAVVAVAAALGLLDDERTDVGVGEMALRVLVVIPIGTVLVEELAFRGVLYGLLERVTSPGRAIAAGAMLFGLWHAPPLAGDGVAVVAGTVAATTVAGVGFVWLRRRSDSLLAPVLAHLATNSVTFALSWAAP